MNESSQFTTKRPHTKDVDNELTKDPLLRRLKDKRKMHEEMNEQMERGHQSQHLTDADIAADKLYQQNRSDLERIQQKIDQRTREITQAVERYNNQQQSGFANAS